MENKIKATDLVVGYGKKPLISHIDIQIEPGQILTLIGPNGSGKSTILKTITGQLQKLGGCVSIFGRDMEELSSRERALRMSIVTTEKVQPELMTCREVIAMGRYPYTGTLGILSEEDWQKVDEAIQMVNAGDVADLDFHKISDGQRQRVMLARAICQDTEVIVLDEPTSYLDMHYKLDLLKHIRRLAKKEHKAIILSLHELDLVKMISDTIVCVDGENVVRIGKPEEIFAKDFLQQLYQVAPEEFDPYTATMHLLEETSTEPEETIPDGAGESKGEEPDEIKKTASEKTQASAKTHARVIMVQGTMSNAGKSLVVAGLCRIFKQDGYRVAPFKSQNMALNSFITKEGLEMGRAQVMQAEAAGIAPMVCMNPILLKPTNDSGSQVIVNGEVLGNMPAKEYFAYKKKLIPDIIKAFEKLEEQADIIVIEGAGSPAEINLRENDIVNMGLAELLDAPVLLVGDIDRGGVFAQLLGTLMLLSKEEKQRVKGLIINKFRGDKTILDPGIAMLEEKGQIPVTGVLPYMRLVLDDEDSLSSRFEHKEKGLINIGVVRLPRISNFTDFSVFEQLEGVTLHYVDKPLELEQMDLLMLPGSKNTIGDMRWLRESGMETAVKRFSQERPVFGICGGYQMLGKLIRDPEGVEEGGSIAGMGLLDMETTLCQEKIRRQVTGRLGQLSGPLACLSGKEVQGYEIHMGDTLKDKSAPWLSRLYVGLDGQDKVEEKEDGTYCGNVYGSYIHGFFDQGDMAYTLVQALAGKKGVKLEGRVDNYQEFKEKQYDLLADTMRQYIDMEALYGMLREANISEEKQDD